ncbi:hypothetical protein RHS01_06818 [Rhizoctonia solani]|uniref:Uncharacterized protein n=1 Tax=Rhizoctonia solani TaxID=456999 RepID=A0A8H7I9D7_9AGAM|nr:hypothetical protein RHS01_06818 [Rhizoctonia solani]
MLRPWPRIDGQMSDTKRQPTSGGVVFSSPEVPPWSSLAGSKHLMDSGANVSRSDQIDIDWRKHPPN